MHCAAHHENRQTLLCMKFCASFPVAPKGRGNGTFYFLLCFCIANLSTFTLYPRIFPIARTFCEFRLFFRFCFSFDPGRGIVRGKGGVCMDQETLRRKLAEHRPSLQQARGEFAVLVPLVEGPEGLSLLYEVRPAKLHHHSGEVCFPGGRMEPERRPGSAPCGRPGRSWGSRQSGSGFWGTWTFFICGPRGSCTRCWPGWIRRRLCTPVPTRCGTHSRCPCPFCGSSARDLPLPPAAGDRGGLSL